MFAVARQLGVAPEAILDFSASINPLGPAAVVREAVTAAFDRVVHYPETGSPRVCRALADYHGLPPERLVVANGSTELIHLLPRFCHRAGGRALLVSPTFSEYAHALQLAGWRCTDWCLAPDNGFALDVAALAAECAQGYDLLFFCNPGNPSGRLYLPDEVMALYRACSRAGCFFVLDEAFMDFAEDASLKGLLPAAADDWLILRSMTKFFGFPGLRLGYGIGSAAVVARLGSLLPPWSVGVLAEAAALAALADAEHCRQTRQFVARERERLAAGLGRLGWLRVYGGAANFLLLATVTGIAAAELQRRLLGERILIRDCANFAGLDERFFRVAVRTAAENDRLLAALARCGGDA